MTEHSKRSTGHDLASNRDNNRDPSRKHRRAPAKTSDKDKARYTPRAGELEAIKAYVARLNASPSLAPRLNVDQGNISPNHPDRFIADMLLAEALGTADFRISDGLINQLARAAAQDGEIDERRLNFLLAVITASKPRNELEAMLTAQMAAVHMATMECAGRLGQAAFTSQFDSIQGAFNKLARTFAFQFETLKRNKSGADDRVLLQQNVSVTEGGQAIVGNVHQTPKETPINGRPLSNPTQTHAPGNKVLMNGAQGRRDRRPRRTNEEQSSA
jgi:hypothetical protein